MKRLLAVVLLGAVLAPSLASAQPAPIVVMPAQEEYVPVHQIQAGLGVPICFFAGVSGFGSDSDCVSGDFVLLNIPLGACRAKSQRRVDRPGVNGAPGDPRRWRRLFGADHGRRSCWCRPQEDAQRPDRPGTGHRKHGDSRPT